MPILIPAILCILAALGVFVLSRRSRFRYFWLVSVGSVLLVWISALAAWLLIPFEPLISNGSSLAIFESALSFRWDLVSSSLSVAFATLLLAVLLTDVRRASDSDWRSWGGSLLVTGVILAGLLSANLFTLILFMGLTDLVILGLQLLIHRDQVRIGLAIKAWAYRGIGSLLLFLAAILGLAGGIANLPKFGLILLILFLTGLFLRLGLLPLRWASFEEPGPNRGFGTILSIAPVGLALLLILRIETETFSPIDFQWVVILLAAISILIAWNWMRSNDELTGRSYFLSAAASITLIAVLSGYQNAGLPWSLSLIFSGGVLFLFKIRRSWFIILPLLGFWGISGLPFSASWAAMRIYSPPFQPILAASLILQSGLLAGYLTHTLRLDQYDEDLERWELVIYPLGIIILPLVNLIIVWLPWRGLEVIQGLPWWPGFLAAALGVGFWWILQRDNFLHRGFSVPWQKVADFLSVAAHEIARGLGRVIDFISFLLEGEGGVLWALLFLALLITLVTQVSLLVTGNGS